MIKSINVFDLDGVLIDSTHRYRVGEDGRIDLAYWRANEHRAYHDTLMPLHHTYLELLRDPEVYVCVATARELREPDDSFIRDKLTQPPHIISRKIGDCRSGGVIKVAGLNKLLSLRQFDNVETMVVWEDNHSYLKHICDAFMERYNVRGQYIPSNQGH